MDETIANLQALDVCIVGAGPAGITAAFALGSAGRRVAVLESGGFYASDQAQELNEGDQEGVAYEGLIRTRHRQVGGTVNTWNVPVRDQPGAKYVPLSASDMAEWPISLSDLHPYYVEAQALCGLGPFEYDAEYWATSAHSPYALDGTGLKSGVYQFGTAERFNGALTKSLRDAESVSIIPSVTVIGLSVEPRARRVLGVRAVDADGQSLEVKARTLILACGAVENARLLLLAGLGREPGLGWVGRGFMEHARDFSLVLVPDSAELFDASSFYDLHAAADGTLIGGRLSLTDEALHTFGLPNAAMTLVPRYRTGPRRGVASRVFNSVRRVARNLSIRRAAGTTRQGRYGWSRVPSPADTFDVFRVVLNLEQRPHLWNRIGLSTRSDRFGNALPRLTLQWTEEEQALLNELRELLGEWFRTARLGHLIITEGHRPDLNAHHHAGTTRMATNPQDGVVDPDGRVFGYENLYLAGASVFPTAGFANPTLTIVALALRLARYVDASFE